MSLELYSKSALVGAGCTLTEANTYLRNIKGLKIMESMAGRWSHDTSQYPIEFLTVLESNIMEYMRNQQGIN